MLACWRRPAHRSSRTADDTSAITLGLKFTRNGRRRDQGVAVLPRRGEHRYPHRDPWTADGQSLATLTFTDSGVGWQTANFDAPVEVTAGTTYVAELLRAERSLLGRRSGYFNSPVTNVPLASVARGGVYLYGNDFPTQSYLNSHYYVDVVFTTPTTTRRRSRRRRPANDATAVPAGTTVNGDLQPGHHAGSLEFTLTDAAGTARVRPGRLRRHDQEGHLHPGGPAGRRNALHRIGARREPVRGGHDRAEDLVVHGGRHQPAHRQRGHPDRRGDQRRGVGPSDRAVRGGRQPQRRS